MAAKPIEFPGWLADCLRCPTCAAPLWLTVSGQASCRKVPAHTGIIPMNDIVEQVIGKYAIVLARGQTDLKREKIPKLVKKFLKASALTISSTDEVVAK